MRRLDLLCIDLVVSLGASGLWRRFNNYSVLVPSMCYFGKTSVWFALVNFVA